MAKAFAHFFGLDRVLEYREHNERRPAGAQRWGPQYEAWLAEHRGLAKRLEKAVRDYLVEVRASVGLHVVEYAEERGHRWGRAWNNFARGSSESGDVVSAVMPICQELSLEMSMGKSLSPLSMLEALDKKMAAGCFDSSKLDKASSECSETGESLKVEIRKGWRPRLGQVSASNNYDFVALAGPLSEPSVICHSIPAPSGEMLLADWFSLDGDAFTRLVQEGEPDDSINYPSGKARASEHYAKKFGVMSVFVGNTSPSMVMRDGHAILARVDSEAEAASKVEGSFAGSVCTDMWWATMVDRQHLEKMLAIEHGHERARELVEKLVVGGDVEVVRLPKDWIVGGEVCFYHTARVEDLGGFKCSLDDGTERVSRESVEALYAVVGPAGMTWTLDGKPKHVEDAALGAKPSLKR